MGFSTDFLNFLKEYEILGLAVAFVIGISVNDLVSATVEDIIMPVVNLLLGGGSWESFTFTIFGAQLRLGHFLGALLDFLVIALLVFVFVSYVLRNDNLEKI